MSVRSFCCLVLLALCGTVCSGFRVQAAETVRARSAEHDSYSRIVFDWEKDVGYAVGKENGTVLVLRFDRVADANLSGVAPGELSAVRSIRQSSGPGDPLQIRIEIPRDTEEKLFRLGSKLVLDLYKPSKSKPVEPAQVREKKRPAPAPAPEKKEEEKQGKALPAPAPKIEQHAPKPSPQEPEKEIHHEEEAAPKDSHARPTLAPDKAAFSPHVIHVSSSRTVGLAVFQRLGYLWIVTDAEKLPVPPILKGPQRDRFPRMESLDAKNGQAFRLKLPAPMNVYAEGGGLEWRVVLSPEIRPLSPAEPVRQGEKADSILLPLSGARSVIALADPSVGDQIRAVTVSTSNQYTGLPLRFVDMEILGSSAGAAVNAKTDDISVTIVPDGVLISRPNGLTLSEQKNITGLKLKEKENARQKHSSRKSQKEIFDMANWAAKDPEAFQETERMLVSVVGGKDEYGRAEDLLTLAKMELAAGHGPEATGFLKLALEQVPDLSGNAVFLALRGAGNALAGHNEAALTDLSHSSLEGFRDIDYWKAYVLAGLEDWKQAAEILPGGPGVLESYPPAVRDRIQPTLAEIALRAGQPDKAERFLDVDDPVDRFAEKAYEYLRGELHRQKGEMSEAIDTWSDLAKSRDDFYKVKAGLALTQTEIREKKISPVDAIDRLESLRYGWRGDALETNVNQTLGRLYLQAGEYIKGLNVLRNAAAQASDPEQSKKIAADMSKIFQGLFSGKNLDALTPVQAMSVYEEFGELVPPGPEGDRLVRRLADRLVASELLDKAASFLEHQVKHRLKGAEAGKTATRLAVIRLRDDDARRAIEALDAAEKAYSEQSGAFTPERKRELALLRARALSRMGKTSEALAGLASLPEDRDALLLKADIAWRNGQWEQVADSLESIVVLDKLSPTRPLTNTQADVILNWAVALNLSGDRTALNDVRNRYKDQMHETPSGRMFETVTRPHRNALLADRQTIEALVSEVDLFRDFLNSYRQADEDL